MEVTGMASPFGMETWLTVTLVVLFTFLVVENIYCFNLSGFRLYLIGLGIQGITILVGLSIVVVTRLVGWRAGGGLAFGIILVGSFVASFVERRQMDNIRKMSSTRWNAWADKAMHLKQSSLLNRLLLPKIERVDS
jgi:hypothetical protein